MSPPDGDTALLTQVHTGSHVFELPEGIDYSVLSAGADCGEEQTGGSVTIGLGDDRFVWPAQSNVPCGGVGGGALTSYPTEQLPGTPTRLYVLTGDDVEYAVGVWGSTSPSSTP
ncbi:hypothetical protein AB2L28_12835 [Kineococcus sp. TBRC 1896]|uniref:Uncharacterized protein n=1 Tax=Kineococcus mangrovi TaxID=1660183 RepID=A0ABV4I545_9ACTN